MSNNFTVKAENALNRAVKIAEEHGHTYIGTEHILLALAEDEGSCASILLRKSKISYESILSLVKEYSGIGTNSALTSKDTTPKCRKILEASYKISKKYSSDKIGTEHILLAIIEEKECVGYKILTKCDTDVITLRDNAITFLRTSDSSLIYATEAIPDSSIPTLTRYGKNLTALAEKEMLDPVIGRDKETDRLIRVLSRRTKNNPCLIGEAGVGKTAIVEGLATRIVEGKVPAGLASKIVISLDLTSMVAGAKYRGDFEERIKNAMMEVKKNKSIILFIDEIHTIVGAGSAEGAIDAANILKPELSRGEIQLIGATTLAEYRKYIEKDSALERRFQPIIVEEPNIQGTIDILNGLRSKYELHHGVKISNKAIEEAARLSHRYITDRFLPDKAIDILDEACAMANVSINVDSEETRNRRDKIRQTSEKKKIAIKNRDFDLAKKLGELERVYTSELTQEIGTNKDTDRVVVSPESVYDVIKEITGIDPRIATSSNRDTLRTNLSKSIIGQDEAIDALSKSLIRSFAGINSPDKPRGVFLFLGESGVGKTALSKALAKELFKTDESLIRYDMSEYSEAFSVSKFIGSPPGYVGYDEHNSALESIRKHPYSVILFDEIDKAHPDVLSLLLQILDSGNITDATGRKIDFRNTYIIMTSNLHAGKIGDGSIGFMNNCERSTIRMKLKEHFKEEFLNRIDEIILFPRLEISALKQIAEVKISELSTRLIPLGISLSTDSFVFDFIADHSTDIGFGARSLDRFIVKNIENHIAEMMVNSEIKFGDTISISVDNDKLSVRKATFSLNSGK